MQLFQMIISTRKGKYMLNLANRIVELFSSAAMWRVVAFVVFIGLLCYGLSVGVSLMG